MSDHDVLEYMASQEGERGLAACRFLVNRILDNAAERGISMLTTDDNWNKEKLKMQCTLEQLMGIDWKNVIFEGLTWGAFFYVVPGMYENTCDLLVRIDDVVALRKSDGSGWRFQTKEMSCDVMMNVSRKLKLIDEFIERELNKKWQPLPPMDCEFAYSPKGIIGIVNTDLEREVCQVGKFSALLANELIKRDGSKHIDAKRSMLTYRLEWPCEEVSQ